MKDKQKIVFRDVFNKKILVIKSCMHYNKIYGFYELCTYYY
jgi:hypothetical protein